MKLTIDFENKTVSFDSTVNVNDLVKKLKEILPNDWKDYQLISITYSYPKIYPSFPIIPIYDNPTITCDTAPYTLTVTN